MAACCGKSKTEDTFLGQHAMDPNEDEKNAQCAMSLQGVHQVLREAANLKSDEKAEAAAEAAAEAEAAARLACRLTDEEDGCPLLEDNQGPVLVNDSAFGSCQARLVSSE